MASKKLDKTHATKRDIPIPGKFKRGDRITWVARGKGARADGVSGQQVYGTVTTITHESGVGTLLHVRGEYASMFDGHLVPMSAARYAPKGGKK